MEDLRKIQLESGARFSEDNIPVSFGNDDRALIAAREEVVLCDRSHWGLLQISGEERLRYLHNQSTNAFENLTSGQGCDTVFVTSTARTLDLATAYVTDESVLVLVSPNRRQQLLEWLDRFIFPFDKVELSDLSANYAVFTLFGAKGDDIIEQLGLKAIIAQPEYSHQLLQIDNVEVRIAVGSGLALPGYTLIVPVGEATQIWSKLTAIGAMPIGDRLWEQLRIQQGRPIPERELTEDYNPLEAGLWHTLSFDKGCYIGQETIARLNTYQGVKQKLWGIKLSDRVEPETLITVDNNKVGKITSYIDTPAGSFALGYVRTKAGGEGLEVKVGDADGVLVSVPFLKHQQ